MAWPYTVDKPLAEPMMNQFTDAYFWRQASVHSKSQNQPVGLRTKISLAWIYAYHGLTDWLIGTN